MSLRHLPFEIVAFIAGQLDLDDIYHLSLSCRQFAYLIRENRICKGVLESAHAAASESQEARDSSRKSSAALRRLFKRREAIRSACPYTVAIVGVAESYLYVNGTLCHILERTLRILDLHHSSKTETVIDIRALLDEAITESRGTRKYKFLILHYAEGIISCLYTHSRPSVESWLVVLNVNKRKVLTSRNLESSYKIFVRNDSNYLYYGTHSEFGEDGFRRWVLKGYNITDDKWLKQKVHLLDMVGSDIGSSIAFEIIDGSFYGLSNQTSFEVEEVDWTSYYHCFRFPVDTPSSKNTERSIKREMWRRQHAEGPIDDRWSFIRIQKDEKDGKLQVLESRKEWVAGQSSGKRTYYTTNLVFPEKKEQETNEECSNEQGSSSHDEENSPELSRPSKFSPPPETEGPRRLPQYTHRGDDANTALMFTLSKCFIRSYHSPCQTFLDLVNDPLPSDPSTQRLRLRVGSRQVRSAEELKAENRACDGTLPVDEQIKMLYKKNGENNIILWPEKRELRADPFLDDLNAVLNPPSHLGNVKGTWDERSLVYSTGNNANGGQALVFVSFDAGIYLHGLRPWGGEKTPGQGINGDQDESTDAQNVAGKGKGKGTAPEYSPQDTNPSPIGVSLSGTADDTAGTRAQCHSSDEPVSRWARTEPAMYQEIMNGFNFHL